MSTSFYPRKARKNAEREERFFNHRGHSAAEPQPVVVVLSLSLSKKPDKIDSEPVPYGNGCMKSVQEKQEMDG
uniref:Uncharacterized protein n=1 Tax=Candidatus Kentrum sp. FM TaxID=2126340 RepID=A0A450WDC5_9GAMM|nr:MAG: hypothetical protein BECKFM1743A_GA0114220_101202 [Candidatus Kentron sp. FM]VFK15086.1 MAG: hypothetical protein BECKFM1743B_GA0114221_103541 [Candidatus Kentron sp. FM]